MTRAPAPAFVLGSGVNALGILRSLGRHGVPAHLFTSSGDDLAARSRFAASVERIDPRDSQATLATLLERARATGARPALFFTTDRSLLLASRHRDALGEAFQLQLPPAASVEIVADKVEFGRWMQAERFQVPRTFEAATLDDVTRVAELARFPVVIKPALSFDWSRREYKMWLVGNRAELISAFTRVASGCEVLIQEYVDAPDDQHFAYYSYRTPERGERVHVTVQKLRVYPIHAGAGSFVRVVREPELEAMGRAVLERLDYTGVASVCFKRSAATREPFIYEINGRMPQCHGAFRVAGIDLPWLMYRDAIGAPVEAPAPRRRRGAWVSLSLDLSAFRSYRAQGELGVARWLASYRSVRTCAEFAWDDPAPLLALLRRIGRRLTRTPGTTDGDRATSA